MISAPLRIAMVLLTLPVAACGSGGGSADMRPADAHNPSICTMGSQCISGICMNSVCIGTQSTAPQAACTGNLDCQSQLCLGGLCANPTTPGEQCKADSECPSGTCSAGNCMGDGTAPVQKNCLANADCMSGICQRRQCAEPPCTADTDCTTSPNGVRCNTTTGVCGCMADADCIGSCNTTTMMCRFGN